MIDQFAGCTELANGDLLLGDPREATAPRTTFGIGDADSQQVGITITSGYDIGDGELYGFLTYSSRDNESAAFFRHNNNNGGNAPLQDGDATIPAGFLPKINTEIRDISYNFGYQTDFDNGAMLDLSYTYGENTIDYVTSDTINSSFANSLRYGGSGLSANDIRSTIPRSAFAYGLELTLQTINLDYSQDFDLFSLAMGAEVRTDEYFVTPGDEYSYRDYDSEQGESLYVDDRTAGTQGFGGIGPVSMVDESRDVFSVYVDAESKITDDLIVSAALRYDDYDGFGDTTNAKLAANWSLTEDFSLRSAVSTGFRAPSMQQLYFNNISTQFVTDPNNPGGDQIAQQVGTFRNDSVLAQAIGIPELKEEESVNYSFGAVYQATENLNFTIDFYAIDIEDRIGLQEEVGFFLLVAGGILLALRDGFPEHDGCAPFTGRHVGGTTHDVGAQLLPLVECRPPTGLEAMVHRGDFEQQWIDAAVAPLADDIGGSAGVAVEAPRTTPRGELSRLQVLNDLAGDLFSDLRLAFHVVLLLADGVTGNNAMVGVR